MTKPTREKKADRIRQHRAWDQWIEQHRRELSDMGLPPEIYQSLEHWLDFLANGHLHWHQSFGFRFLDLSRDQMARLCTFLEAETPFRSDASPLREWLLFHLGRKEIHTVTNSRPERIDVWFEPWGNVITLEPGEELLLHTTARRPGALEINEQHDKIVITAWPTCTLRVLQGGKVVDNLAMEAPA